MDAHPQDIVQTCVITMLFWGRPWHLCGIFFQITRRRLQELFHIEHGHDLTKGRDIHHNTKHDYLRVECAWRVKNPDRLQRYTNFVPTSTSFPQRMTQRNPPTGVTLRKALVDASAALLGHMTQAGTANASTTAESSAAPHPPAAAAVTSHSTLHPAVASACSDDDDDDDDDDLPEADLLAMAEACATAEANEPSRKRPKTSASTSHLQAAASAGSDDEQFTEADLLAMSEACAAAEAKEPSSGRPKIGSSVGQFGDAASLAKEELGRPCEHLLLHGTKPENLYDILFGGLDPGLAHNGLFGKGVYLAETAAKIDQYITEDAEWHGKQDDASHPLHKLHKKLYESGVKHPGGVYYALVVRAKFDHEPAVTMDGVCPKDAPGEALFVDRGDRCKLTGGKHSLVAELGGKICRYREFVMFDHDAIQIEYLVALKRVERYCECGDPLADKTVVKDTDNQGRAVKTCHLGRGAGCGYFQMYPLCHCGDGLVFSYSVWLPGERDGRGGGAGHIGGSLGRIVQQLLRERVELGNRDLDALPVR